MFSPDPLVVPGLGLTAVALHFFNYNTVEMVLLGSAVFVCLCGVMYESTAGTEGQFDNQRDIVTVALVIIVTLSIIYCTRPSSHSRDLCCPRTNCPSYTVPSLAQS